MKQEKPKIYERKDGMVKIYNGHLGTFVWEKEETYKKQKESELKEKEKSNDL